MSTSGLQSGLGRFNDSSSLFTSFCFLRRRRPPISTLFPYTTLFRSNDVELRVEAVVLCHGLRADVGERSEEHTSELQSRLHLVCRLLLEKKKPELPTHMTHPAFSIPAQLYPRVDGSFVRPSFLEFFA